jgi:hypothetical protein
LKFGLETGKRTTNNILSERLHFHPLLHTILLGLGKYVIKFLYKKLHEMRLEDEQTYTWVAAWIRSVDRSDCKDTAFLSSLLEVGAKFVGKE